MAAEGRRKATRGQAVRAPAAQSIGAVREQEFYRVFVVFSNGRLQRGLAALVSGVDVGTVREEEFRHVPALFSRHAAACRRS